ncbi:MAG: hypothetical protein AAFZ38_11460, partial [Myxococcota bacterium]
LNPDDVALGVGLFDFFDSVSASAFGFYGEGTGHYAFADGLGAFATASVSPLFLSEDFELQLAVVGGIRYTLERLRRRRTRSLNNPTRKTIHVSE